MDFPELVRLLLVEEHGETREEAERLVKTYTQVVVNGIMGGFALRPTAMALLMMKDKENGQ